MLFSCLSVWVTAALSVVGIALFVLDLWYNGKMSGMAITGLVISALGLFFSVYIIILGFIVCSLSARDNTKRYNTGRKAMKK